jgi:tetratricopeptide (TPR) repeat protein
VRRLRLALALATLAAFASSAQGPAAPPPADELPAPPPAPADARALLAQAERLRFAEDWYPAIDGYLAAAAKNPSYGEAYAGLAECYYELGEYDQALSYLRRAAPFRRGDAALADLEGFVRIGLGDLKGARAAFDSVAARLPNDLDARFGLSLLDLAAGKKTEARSRLEESLRLSPQNGRALLSLALIAQDQGRSREAQALVERALRYHGSEPRTQYVAASLAASAGDFQDAAFHARSALDLKPGYGEARLLLGGLMYRSGSYDQAIALMREAVARNRKDALAWYTLGMAQVGAGKRSEAVYSLKTAAGLAPDDEIARLALEYAVADSTPAEEPSRAAYADWHVARGREFEDRSSYDQAIFEYRRALRVYPYSKPARLAYAGMLKARDYPGKYLSELRFLAEGGLLDAKGPDGKPTPADQAVLDAIETYDSLLADAVGRAWGVDEETLPKRPYRIALSYLGDPGSSVHAAGQELALRYLKDILASSSRLEVIKAPQRAASLAEAFKAAREAEADYFALVAMHETERDVEIRVELRVARTGSLAASYASYRSGNDRLKNCAARAVDLIASSLPPQGSLVRRSQDKVLVDLGKTDGIKVGDRLVVLRRGSATPNPEGLGLSYPQSAALGEIAVESVGEEASSGSLKRSGFFDAVNIGDQVCMAPPPAAPAAPAGKAPAAGTPAGGPSTGIPAAPPATAVEPRREWPGLFTAVRQLR